MNTFCSTTASKVICPLSSRPLFRSSRGNLSRSAKHRILYAVEDGRESRAAGRMTYQPESFEALVQDACAAVEAALEDGQKRLEVDFPPLPPSVSGYKGSSDDFIDANAQLAVSAAQKLFAQGKRVMLLFPDATEMTRAQQMYEYVLSSENGIAMGSTSQSLIKSVQRALENNSKRLKEEIEGYDCFVILNHSTVELPGMQKYVEEVIEDRPVILWNLELETLRSDLGLFGFPPRSLHFNFLCQFKSAFFLRLRDYAKTISKPPFLVNYSGALFREYPGPWQVMLREDTGRYVCIAEDRVRYSLYDVKEELLGALGLNTEDEGSPMEFLRRGYKRSTWWESDLTNEVSKNWRT